MAQRKHEFAGVKVAYARTYYMVLVLYNNKYFINSKEMILKSTSRVRSILEHLEVANKFWQKPIKYLD